MYKLVETQSNAPSYTLMKAGVNENVSLVDVTFDTLRKDGTGGNCIRFYFQDEGGAKFTQTYMEVTSLERLKESAKMVFLDFGRTSGVSNIELVTKGAEGTNRSFIKKYVAGMINPYDQSSMMAANADDKFEGHVLSEY